MGYRGKVEEQARARGLRAEGLKLAEIAERLGVSKSSVSLWVRDIPVVVERRRRGPAAGAATLRRRKEAEIARLHKEAAQRIGQLSEREFLIAGTALYAGEGAKGDGEVLFANTNPRLIRFFCAWLRHFFDIDETRLRCRLYLHEDLDLEAAVTFWSQLTDIPPNQFHKPYRAAADPTHRNARHEQGCLSVRYGCSRTHRTIIGLVEAMLAAPSPRHRD
ncbi:MAG: hypothetical protein M3133_02915 [Actinomycetota bacterium]|nr:hypothetical protein [Actinomycetota bacterium]